MSNYLAFTIFVLNVTKKLILKTNKFNALNAKKSLLLIKTKLTIMKWLNNCLNTLYKTKLKLSSTVLYIIQKKLDINALSIMIFFVIYAFSITKTILTKLSHFRESKYLKKFYNLLRH